MAFDRNGNSNTESGKYFTVVTDHTEFGGGMQAWSFFNGNTAISSLQEDDRAGFPSVLVLTSEHYRGEDVTHVSLGAA